MTLFNEPLICASNNGFWSEFWNPTRGCRQGCTFSPGIFAIMVERLGTCQNDQIEGITLEDTKIKAGQFADDLWTVTPSTQDSVNETLNKLNKFKAFLGLKINLTKCAMLRIGSHRDAEARFYMLKRLYWSPGPVKILGFHKIADLLKIIKHNFDELLCKAEAILQHWMKRNITIMGKIVVINHLVNSLFIHKLMALLTPPECFFIKYKRLITKILWNEGVVKISYDRLTKDYNRLGLKLVDLKI